MKPYYDQDGITIYHGDCREILPLIPDRSIDLVLTDPPYGIGKQFANDNLPMEEYLDWCKTWLGECGNKVKYGGALWATLGWQIVAEIKMLMNSQKDFRLKNWIIWYRQDGWKGDKGFSQSHEHILYYIKDNLTPEIHGSFIDYLNKKRADGSLSLADINKHFGWASNGGGCASSYMGDKEDNYLPTLKHYKLLKIYLGLDNRFDELPFGVKFNKCDVSDDVWLKPKSENNRLGHPTQKPIALMSRIIEVSSDRGDLILDPFLGSGTVAFACKLFNRKCIGIEIEEKYCEIAVKRLSQSVMGLS